jgi:hypothetical protein
LRTCWRISRASAEREGRRRGRRINLGSSAKTFNFAAPDSCHPLGEDQNTIFQLRYRYQSQRAHDTRSRSPNSGLDNERLACL